ncbi:hypothetical protein Anas_12252 [Armadillidium nasatum]|uniref:Uncharacterized protein n=1 Tax=Armadillidium nasatum TaxID=96803 RepID=A0A5N5SZK3_9CRUS|nr:hypothetical protein Anas_12252 [Armadillidium nasatum]
MKNFSLLLFFIFCLVFASAWRSPPFNIFGHSGLGFNRGFPHDKFKKSFGEFESVSKKRPFIHGSFIFKIKCFELEKKLILFQVSVTNHDYLGFQKSDSSFFELRYSRSALFPFPLLRIMRLLIRFQFLKRGSNGQNSPNKIKIFLVRTFEGKMIVVFLFLHFKSMLKWSKLISQNGYSSVAYCFMRILCKKDRSDGWSDTKIFTDADTDTDTRFNILWAFDF